jgi:hypothetical protein
MLRIPPLVSAPRAELKVALTVVVHVYIFLSTHIAHHWLFNQQGIKSIEFLGAVNFLVCG